MVQCYMETIWPVLFGRLTIPEDMKIDLKAKLIVSLIHVGYLDCFAVCLSLQFIHLHVWYNHFNCRFPALSELASCTSEFFKKTVRHCWSSVS